MFRYLIGLLALMFGAQTLAEESLVILKSPLKVVASYEDPEYRGEACGMFIVTFSVGGGDAESVETKVFRCGNDKDSVKAQLRKLVSWRPPYLALRTNCGMSNGWNCDTQLVFSYRNRKLTRLGHVNDFLLLAKQPLFLKNYTVVEYNDLVAHTGKRVPLVLRDAGTAFSFDADMSWVLNHEQYRQFEYGELQCDPKTPECEHAFKAAAVFNSTIAKVTGKQTELQSVLAKSKKRLNAEEFEQLTKMLKEVDAQGVIKHMTEETY